MPEAEDTRLSLEEQLSAAYDRAQLVDAPVETTEPVETNEPLEPADTATDRLRDEAGKFKAAEAAKDAPIDEAAPKKLDDTVQKPEVPAVEATAIQPPVSLSAAAKAEWANAPPAIQQAMLKRESDIGRYVQQTSAQLKQFDAIQQQIAPVQKEMESFYGDVPTALKTLFSISDYATKNPYEYMRWFAQQRGLDVNQAINYLAGNGAAPQVQQQAHNPQIANLMQKVSTLESRITQEDAHRQAAQERAAAEAVSSFESDPENKHLEAVREDMIALLDRGVAKDIKEAYERAVWARPDIRALMIAEQQTAQEAKRRDDAAKMAKKANNAASLAQATKGGAAGSVKQVQTMDDVLSAAYDRAHGVA